MVDRSILAKKLAAIRDAVARIEAVLPSTADAFVADRTAREVVSFNLFLALQEAISLAAHWLADEGAEVPATYGEVFAALGNLIAHQYGVLDFRRVFAVARDDQADLLAFCQQLAARAGE